MVVTLDKATGEAHAIGRADEFSPAPSDTEIRYFLSKFIANVRGVPLDQVVLRKNVLEAYVLREVGCNCSVGNDAKRSE